MRRGTTGFIMAGVTALAVSATPAMAQDASGLLGVWELERETPMGVTTVLVTFVQEGDSTLALMGRGEDAVPVGRVEYEDGVVSFPFDMRAVMAGLREGRAGPPRGTGSEGMRRQGSQRPDGAGSPVFRGALEGDLIRGNVMRPRNGAGPGPEMVLRRAGGS